MGTEETSDREDSHDPAPEASEEDVETVREQLTEVRQGLGRLGRTVAHRSGETGKAAIAGGKAKVDDTYRTLTLKEYRDEVDQALADITQVLLVLEARVSGLESERGGD